MKKNFNNLFDSIVLTVFTIVEIIFYIFMLFLTFKGTLHHYLLAFLIFTLLFGIPSVVCIVIIILGCYEYWYIDNDVICSKKIFRKKVFININDIVVINKKEVEAVIFETFKTEAYIIESENQTIKIYITKNKNIEILMNLINEKK